MTEIEDRETFALITYWAGVIQSIAVKGFNGDHEKLPEYICHLSELITRLQGKKN